MCMFDNRQGASAQVSVLGSSFQFAYTTKWMFLYGADAATVYEQLQRGGADADYRQEVYYRTAEVWTGEPSGWTGTGNVRSGLATAADPFSWTASVSVASLWNGTSGKAMWIQFAVKAKSNVAATVVASWSRLVVSLDNKAKVVAARTRQVGPSATAQILPLSRWFAAQDLSKVMGAFRVTGVNGTLSYQLVFRTLAGPGSYPSAWAAIGTAQSTAADKLYNTGDLTVTAGTNLSTQVGLQVSGTVTATVQAIVAARYA
jgi:hypothetical protein